MTKQEAKDYLKKQYPKFNGFIEHTMVAEMALNLAKEYHTKQLNIHSVVVPKLAEDLWCDLADESDGWQTTMSYESFTKAIHKALTIPNVVSSACSDYQEGINMQCAKCDHPKYEHTF